MDLVVLLVRRQVSAHLTSSRETNIFLLKITEKHGCWTFSRPLLIFQSILVRLKSKSKFCCHYQIFIFSLLFCLSCQGKNHWWAFSVILFVNKINSVSFRLSNLIDMLMTLRFTGSITDKWADLQTNLILRQNELKCPLEVTSLENHEGSGGSFSIRTWLKYCDKKGCQICLNHI